MDPLASHRAITALRYESLLVTVPRLWCVPFSLMDLWTREAARANSITTARVQSPRPRPAFP